MQNIRAKLNGKLKTLLNKTLNFGFVCQTVIMGFS